MRYRREIDGLRALAVIPVMLFHAGIAGFSGGFVGVDVFFVISGYLITSIILAEMREGTFSFLKFYERRARRILPPLFLVVLTCVPLAIWVMVPRDIVDFSKSLIAVGTFTSNIFFWGQSGYFDTDSELKPLLHTWSLAVEEQFYLVFPFILLLVLKAGKRRVVPIFITLAGASFLLSFWQAHHDKDAAFYLLPMRMWELLIGAAIPLVALDVKRWFTRPVQELLAVLGLLLIVVAMVAYDYMPLHTAYGLFPTVGAFLVIQFSNKDTIVGKLLAARILVGIGLISYSAYLWHQPVFVFARLALFHEPDTAVFVALTLLSIILAALTYKFVEQPVRDPQQFDRRAIFTLSAVGSACLVSLGLVGIQTGGFENIFISRNDPETQRIYALIKRDTGGELTSDMGGNDDCNFWSAKVDAPFKARFEGCVRKYGPATVVLGDSHGMNIYNALFRSSYGKFVVGLVNPGCEPWNRTDACPYLSFDKFLASNQASVGTVIFNISGSHLLKDGKGRTDEPRLFEYGWKYQINYEAIGDTEQYLEDMSKLTRVLWLGPFVEARVDFRNIRGLAKSGFRLNPVSVEIFRSLDASIQQGLRARPIKFGFIPFADVEPDREFIRVGDCLTYRDLDHLSVCGEKIVGEKLKARLLQ